MATIYYWKECTAKNLTLTWQETIILISLNCSLKWFLLTKQHVTFEFNYIYQEDDIPCGILVKRIFHELHVEHQTTRRLSYLRNWRCWGWYYMNASLININKSAIVNISFEVITKNIDFNKEEIAILVD